MAESTPKRMRITARLVVRMLGFFGLRYRDRTGRYKWLVQRTTAIVMVPLYLWLLVFAFPQASVANYEELLAWMSNPLNATLIVLTIIFSFHHMALGLGEIIEDYITTPMLRRALMSCLRWGVFVGMLGILAATFNIFWQS